MGNGEHHHLGYIWDTSGEALGGYYNPTLCPLCIFIIADIKHQDMATIFNCSCHENLTFNQWMEMEETIEKEKGRRLKTCAMEILNWLKLEDDEEEEKIIIQKEQARRKKTVRKPEERSWLEKPYEGPDGIVLWRFQTRMEEKFHSDKQLYGEAEAWRCRKIMLNSNLGQLWKKRRLEAAVKEEPGEMDCYVQPGDLLPPLTEE